MLWDCEIVKKRKQPRTLQWCIYFVQKHAFENLVRVQFRRPQHFMRKGDYLISTNQYIRDASCKSWFKSDTSCCFFTFFVERCARQKRKNSARGVRFKSGLTRCMKWCFSHWCGQDWDNSNTSPIQIWPSCCFFVPSAARNGKAARGSDLNRTTPIREQITLKSHWNQTIINLTTLWSLVAP